MQARSPSASEVHHCSGPKGITTNKSISDSWRFLLIVKGHAQWRRAKSYCRLKGCRGMIHQIRKGQGWRHRHVTWPTRYDDHSPRKNATAAVPNPLLCSVDRVRRSITDAGRYTDTPVSLAGAENIQPWEMGCIINQNVTIFSNWLHAIITPSVPKTVSTSYRARMSDCSSWINRIVVDIEIWAAGIAGIALPNTERLCHDARLFFSKLSCVAEQYWIRVSPRTALKWTSPLLVKQSRRDKWTFRGFALIGRSATFKVTPEMSNVIMWPFSHWHGNKSWVTVTWN